MSDQSRSGLDVPEGSANADQQQPTQMVDTNADDARNEVDTEEAMTPAGPPADHPVAEQKSTNTSGEAGGTEANKSSAKK